MENTTLSDVFHFLKQLSHYSTTIFIMSPSALFILTISPITPCSAKESKEAKSIFLSDSFPDMILVFELFSTNTFITDNGRLIFISSPSAL